MKSQILFSSGAPKSAFSYWGQVVLSAFVFGLCPLFLILGQIAFVKKSFVNPVLNYAFLLLAIFVGVYGCYLLFRETLKVKSTAGFAITSNEIELQLLNNKNRKFQIAEIKEISCSKVPLIKGEFGWFLFVMTSGKEYLVPSKNFDQAREILSSLRVPVRQTRWGQVVLSLLIGTYISTLFFPALTDAVILFYLVLAIYILATRKGLRFHMVTPETETAILCILVFGFLMNISSAHLSAKDRQKLAKHSEISRDVANSKGK